MLGFFSKIKTHGDRSPHSVLRAVKMPIIPSCGHDKRWTANKLTDNTAKSPLPSFSEGSISIPEPLDGHSQTHHELEG